MWKLDRRRRRRWWWWKQKKRRKAGNTVVCRWEAYTEGSGEAFHTTAVGGSNSPRAHGEVCAEMQQMNQKGDTGADQGVDEGEIHRPMQEREEKGRGESGEMGSRLCGLEARGEESWTGQHRHWGSPSK
ncbi:hypothetical protein N7539_004706 [Penicillium diatomitis]|uniref:Uncharacterized protein n=1 Tax=Penicillium diatomitis TaxID=2819901 RepID=A0A9W9X5I9_9EURO|nr:uncharacterized protein N7539_004706 [Penicillium diatomitis]KAJ5484718.1 hypothetical protein N7539_004706 [Penicillium diatomitis]